MKEKKIRKTPVLNSPIFASFIVLIIYLIGANTLGGLLPTTEDPVLINLRELIIYVGLSLLILLYIKCRLEPSFRIGFTGENLRECLILCWPFYVLGVINLLGGFYSDDKAALTLTQFLAALFGGMAPGISEELYSRGIFCNLMLRKWKNTSVGIWMAVILSALIFGSMHLLNVFVARGFTGRLIWQLIYATALGVLFAAVYARTRNMWGLILGHSWVDFCGMLFIKSDGSENGSLAAILSAPLTTGETIYNTVLVVCCIGLSIYLLRPSKHERITELWAGEKPVDLPEEEPTAIE